MVQIKSTKLRFKSLFSSHVTFNHPSQKSTRNLLCDALTFHNHASSPANTDEEERHPLLADDSPSAKDQSAEEILANVLRDPTAFGLQVLDRIDGRVVLISKELPAEEVSQGPESEAVISKNVPTEKVKRNANIKLPALCSERSDYLPGNIRNEAQCYEAAKPRSPSGHVSPANNASFKHGEHPKGKVLKSGSNSVPLQNDLPIYHHSDRQASANSQLPTSSLVQKSPTIENAASNRSPRSQPPLDPRIPLSYQNFDTINNHDSDTPAQLLQPQTPLARWASRGSIRGLRRTRKLRRGELEKLPEIRAVSPLVLEHYEDTIIPETHPTIACAKASAHTEVAANKKKTQPPIEAHREEQAPTAPPPPPLTPPQPSIFTTPHLLPNPLSSHPPRTAPATTSNATAPPDIPPRNPSRPPLLSPLTTEDLPPHPKLHGPGYRYPAFIPSAAGGSAGKIVAPGLKGAPLGSLGTAEVAEVAEVARLSARPWGWGGCRYSAV